MALWTRNSGGAVVSEIEQLRAHFTALFDRFGTPSAELCERLRVRQSTLVVPGAYVGLEGYLRIWLGGREEYLREGLRRIGEELKKERKK